MALISCSDCNNEVSDRAPSCPKCGRPIANSSTSKGTHVVTERTGRKWKLLWLYSWVLLFGMFFSCCKIAGTEAGTPSNVFWSGLTTICLLGAPIAWFSSKIGAWWTNK